MVRDITQRKQKEEELGKLTRILRARNRSSRTMMEAEDELRYLNEVCRIIVEDCGHDMVWIGFADDNENKTIRPVAYAGFEEGYIESLNLTWADRDRGRGPVGTAIRTGKPVITHNIATDDRFVPWRADALRRGYASMIGVPLLSGGKAFGSLAIYSGHPNSFTEEEAVLLTDLVADLSYGITAIRTRSAHAESENKFRDLAEKSVVGVYLIQDGIFKYVNPMLAEIFGYTVGEVIDKKGPEDLVMSEDWPIVRENLRKRISREIESVHYSFRGIKKNKEIIYLEVYSSKTVYKARPAVIGSLLDITERKKAESRIFAYQRKLRSLTQQLSLIEERERRSIAADLHDNIGQMLAISRIKLGALRESEASSDLIGAIDEIYEYIDQAIQYTRSLTSELSPPLLYELGFEAAVESLAGQFQERHGISFKIDIDETPKPLDHDVRILLFKVVHELFVNIVKHAKARRAEISITRDADCVQILVRDDGVGFEASELKFNSEKGFGLFNIRERVESIGAFFDIASQTGQGTVASIVAPLSTKL